MPLMPLMRLRPAGGGAETAMPCARRTRQRIGIPPQKPTRKPAPSDICE
jgi:hypothetical protein